MNQSSSPKAPLMMRMYVLNETVIIERPRKMVDRMRMARGRPVGVILLAFGSTVDTGIDIFSHSKVLIFECSWTPQQSLRKDPGSLLFLYNSSVGSNKDPRSVSRSRTPGQRSESCKRSKDARSIAETATTIIKHGIFIKTLAPALDETNGICHVRMAKKQNPWSLLFSPLPPEDVPARSYVLYI